MTCRPLRRQAITTWVLNWPVQRVYWGKRRRRRPPLSCCWGSFCPSAGSPPPCPSPFPLPSLTLSCKLCISMLLLHPLSHLNKHALFEGWVKLLEQHVSSSVQHKRLRQSLNEDQTTYIVKQTLNTHTRARTRTLCSTCPCSNQCWLETENCNDQNFLERLSWRALLLNLVAGDLPGDAPLPARGDMLGERERERGGKNYWKSASVFSVDSLCHCLSKTKGGHSAK